MTEQENPGSRYMSVHYTTVSIFLYVWKFLLFWKKYIVKETKGEVDKIINLLNWIGWLDEHLIIGFYFNKKAEIVNIVVSFNGAF